MQPRFLSETLIEFGAEDDPKARAERGPKRCVAIATAALFADEALQVSQLGARLKLDYQIGALDSDANVIVEGQEFAYLDWYGEHVWHVYEFCVEEWTGPNTVVLDAEGEPVPHEDPALAALGYVKTVLGPAWRRRAWHPTQAEAVAAATVIATQGA